MVRYTLLLCILLASLAGYSTDYYVKATGNDALSGTSDAEAWQSLSKVSNATFAAGDRILFRRGDTFYGTLTINRSGTSASRMVYDAYGTGANPVLTGFTTVSAWTNLGSNIWESTSTVSNLSTPCNIVTVQGVNTPMGRTPNLGSYYTVNSHSGNAYINCSALTGDPNWQGAQIVQRKEDWIWQMSTVTSQSGGRIYYTDLEGSNQFSPQDGYGFFFQHHAQTLDQTNEWFYDTSTHKLKMYKSSQPTGVKIASLDYVINASSRSYVTLQNLTIDGANISCVYLNGSSNFIVQNCVINHGGLEGIRCNASCTYYTIHNNTIKNCGYAGIFSYQSANNYETITSNTIDSCIMIIGIGRLWSSGAIFSNANNTLIQNNTIDHTGYDGIQIGSDIGLVKNNYITNSLLNRSDGGGIYTAGSSVNLVFEGNIITRSTGYLGATSETAPDGIGIYLDLYTTNVTVRGNVVTGCNEYGFFMHHHTQNNKFLDNISFDNGTAQFAVHDYTGTEQVRNNVSTGNQFISKASTQTVMQLRENANTVALYFSLMDNNTYARPVNNSNYLRAGPSMYMNLSQWQGFSGHDAHSVTFNPGITNPADLSIEYNTTAQEKVVTLTEPKIDLKGNRYLNSITLAPYSGVILAKNSVVTDYYVSPSGTNSNPGTEEQPWQSLVYAVGQIRSPGNTIHLGVGTYTLTSPLDVAPGVSLEGEGIDQTIIVCHLFTGSSSLGAINMNSSNVLPRTNGNQSISLMTVSGDNFYSDRGICTAYRHNVKIHHVKVHSFQHSGIYFHGMPRTDWNAVPYDDRQYITGCELHDSQVNNCSTRNNSNDAASVKFSYQNGFQCYNNTFDQNDRGQTNNGNILGGEWFLNLSVRNNTFYKPDDEGTQWNFFTELWHHRGNCRITGNTFYGGATLDIVDVEKLAGYDYGLSIDNNQFLCGSNPPFTTHQIQAINLEGKRHIEYVHIYNNYIRNYPNGLWIDIFGNTTEKYKVNGVEYNYTRFDIKNVNIHHNVMENVTMTNLCGQPLLVNAYNTNPSSFPILLDSLHIYHNTIHMGSCENQYPTVDFNVIGTFRNIWVQNNIILGGDGYAIHIDEDSGYSGSVSNMTITDNIFYSNGTNGISNSLAQGNTGINTSLNYTGNPVFVDYSLPLPFNFHLTASSTVAIDKGSTAYAPDPDGSRCDIGAYYYNQGTVPTDGTAPVLTAFDIPASSSSLTVSILALTATDNVGVSGWMLTESSTAPVASDIRWGSKPTSYTFSSQGAKTLYVWCRDAAGNVSSSLSAQVTIILPSNPPASKMGRFGGKILKYNGKLLKL